MKPSYLMLAVTLLSAPAWADDDRVPMVRNDLVKKECGSCHMAFQPAFLSAGAWTAIMDHLDKHFGEDATLPADKAKAIRAYLVGNAGSKRMDAVKADALPRITDSPWFQRKHRFNDRVWSDPKVVTKSNCEACHTGAQAGDYEED